MWLFCLFSGEVRQKYETIKLAQYQTFFIVVQTRRQAEGPQKETGW